MHETRPPMCLCPCRHPSAERPAMAIAILLGSRSPTSPSVKPPDKSSALRLPTVYLTEAVKAPPWTSQSSFRLPRLFLTNAIVLLSLITVVIVATRNISICYSGWAWHYTHRCPAGIQHPWAQTTSSFSIPSNSSNSNAETGSPKIAISMVIDNFLDPQLRNQTIENKIQYARKWGYFPYIPNIQQVRDSVPDLPVAWGKFPVIKELFKEYEYVLMIDADAVILRDDISLLAATQLMKKEKTSLLISNDLNGPNSGVFLMRRSEWSNDFLDQAMASASILSAETALLPLRFENRAFLYLLDAWPKCVAVRRFDSLFAPVSPHAWRFRKGVSTVDRCFLNRRPYRATEMRHFFLNTGAGFDDISDAFIGHAAGGGVEAKAKSMQHMLAAVKSRHQTQAVSA